MATTETQVRAHLEPEEPDYQAAAAALGAEALPILERLVRDANPLLASKAAYLASMIPGEQAERVLEQAARSDHPTVRVAAAAGIQRRPDVSDDLANTLAADPDPGVRKVAAKATRGRAAAGKRPTGAGGAAGGAAGTAGSAGAAGPRLTQGEHGGGFSPDTGDAEPSPGEGGGEVGGTRHPSTGPTASIEGESGGGGDVTGTSGAQGGGRGDGPDGGGVTRSGQTGGGSRDSGISAHGGGQF